MSTLQYDGASSREILSPIFFVLTMEQIFRLHDANGDGVDVGNHPRIGVLGYADDVALISRCPETMTKRVSGVHGIARIAGGRRHDDQHS